MWPCCNGDWRAGAYVPSHAKASQATTCVEKKPSTKEEPVVYVILERKALINPVLNCLWALILLILKATQVAIIMYNWWICVCVWERETERVCCAFAVKWTPGVQCWLWSWPRLCWLLHQNTTHPQRSGPWQVLLGLSRKYQPHQKRVD